MRRCGVGTVGVGGGGGGGGGGGLRRKIGVIGFQMEQG